MIGFSYSRETQEFLAEVAIEESPLAKEKRIYEIEKTGKDVQPTEFIIPAFTTTIAPPAFNKGQCPIFDVEKEQWHLVPDNRGVNIYHKKTGKLVGSPYLGELLPAADDPEFTFLTPPEVVDGKICLFINGAWEIRDDVFGKIAYIKATGEALTVVDLDENGYLPKELTLKEPSNLLQKWDENSSNWIDDPEKIKNENKKIVLAKLDDNDLKSIRAIREWILNQNESTLAVIKDCETEAQKMRNQIKGA